MQKQLIEDASTRLLVGQTPHAAGRIICLGGKYATAWLCAVPSDFKYTMSSEEFQVASLAMLGQFQNVLIGIVMCCASHPMQPDGQHLFTKCCMRTTRGGNRGNGTVARRNTMVRTYAALAMEAWVPCDH